MPSEMAELETLLMERSLTDEELLRATDGAPDYVPIDRAYRYLFNSYYEAVGARHPRPTRGLVTRPGAQEVLAYRAHVDAGMARLIANAGAALWAKLALLVELLNRPMRSPNQLNAMGLPVLGVVPILQTNARKKRFAFLRKKRAQQFA